jgi:metal-sulfur cluster biosynthetic enzyme
MYLKEHTQGWVIPSGEPILLWGGQEVEVIYSYSTSCTVTYEGKWIYLGLISSELELPSDQVGYPEFTAEVKRATWYLQLKHLYDPELPLVNIVDLGLIYDISALGNDGIQVVMTLTSPACGMGPALMIQIKDLLTRFDGVTKVVVDIVFTPRWSKQMLTDSAKLTLGLI